MAVKAQPTTAITTPAAVGLATKTGLGGAAMYTAAGIVNLIADGPIEATVSGLALGFGCLVTVLLGRYWQAVKIPHTIENVAKIVDKVLESRL